MDPTLLQAGHVIDLGIGKSTVLPSMDFETYSEAGFIIDPHTGKVKGASSQGKGGLPVVGTPVYAEHPSTEVLCLYYDLKDGQGRRGWLPGMPQPRDLLDYVANGGHIEAFNVTFEFYIWNLVAVRKLGWPPLPMEQCHCVMARSRRHSLPGSLAMVAKVLGTEDKDKAGKALIQKLTRPHTPTKQRQAHRWTPATNWADFSAFYKYCDKDVETEDKAAAHIPDLTPFEHRIWYTDQKINARGVQVDVKALDACLSILKQATERFTVELQQITGGRVGSVSEVAKYGEWLGEQGVHVPDMKADTVTEWLARDDIPPHARRALEIRASLGSANVKKLPTLKLQTSRDGRLRNQYMWCGAYRTGRWSAGGVQLQNLTAKGPKTCECDACGGIFGIHFEGKPCPRCICGVGVKRNDWTVEAVEQAIGDILQQDLDLIIRLWGEPIDLLCGCLRGLLIAKEGHEIVCCDFSAIEAVAAACLARCQWRIDVFNGHGKIYEMSAAKISGIPFDEIVQHKQATGQDHPLRKTLGKVAELASGYGGWVGAWNAFGADKFMSEAETKEAILKWRDESPEIVEMWGGQFRQTGPRLSDGHQELYGLEGMAVAAILNPGQCFAYIDITYAVLGDILYCRLPSGRFLHYHRPKLIEQPGKWGKPNSYKITFEGYNSNSQKGPIGWQVMETYGGRLFENCIAENTDVLTRRGWVPIQNIRKLDEVHDGIEFVAHGGLLFKSEQPCVNIDGVFMTEDHEVLTYDGWKTASQEPQPYRPDIRGVNGITAGDVGREKEKMGLFMRMWRGMRESLNGRQQRRKERPQTKLRVLNSTNTGGRAQDSWYEPTPGVCGLAVDVGPVPTALPSGMGQLWRTGYSCLPAVAKRVYGILGGYGVDLWPGCSVRQREQQWRIFPRELPVGSRESQREQQTDECTDANSVGKNDHLPGLRFIGSEGNDAVLPDSQQLAGRQNVFTARCTQPRKVYDIVNAGPRQRFVVRGGNGPFIVHNCVQAVSADIQGLALARCEDNGYPIVMHTHDEGSAEMPIGQGSVEEMEQIMSVRPEWASWWPLRAAGWRHKRYQKD